MIEGEEEALEHYDKMKILDRILIFANNSFIRSIKNGSDFDNIGETVKNITLAIKAQTELQKVEIARGINNDADKELENKENDFLKEIIGAQTKANNEKENTKTTEL